MQILSKCSLLSTIARVMYVPIVPVDPMMRMFLAFGAAYGDMAEREEKKGLE